MFLLYLMETQHINRCPQPQLHQQHLPNTTITLTTLVNTVRDICHPSACLFHPGHNNVSAASNALNFCAGTTKPRLTFARLQPSQPHELAAASAYSLFAITPTAPNLGTHPTSPQYCLGREAMATPKILSSFLPTASGY